MNKQYTNVPCKLFSSNEKHPHSDDWIKAKCYVCSPGKNRNFTYFSKEELEAAIPSLAYVPVVGKLYEITDAAGNVVGHYFGGHDYEVTDDLEVKSITVPYGCATTDAPWYETVTEFGKEVEYLCCYVYLWAGRYPEMTDAIFSDELLYNHSMEVCFDDYTVYEEDSAFMELHGLKFDALCILGKSDDKSHPERNTTPCFPSASFVPVSEFSLDTDSFRQLMHEMRSAFSACFENSASLEEGGESVLTLNQELVAAILAEYNIAQEELPFEITDDMTEEQLRASLDEMKASDDIIPPASEDIPAEETEPPVDTIEVVEEAADVEPAQEEPTEDVVVDEVVECAVETEVEAEAETEDVVEEPASAEEPAAAEFSTTMSQKRDALIDALCVSATDNTYFYLMDYDDSYVYVEMSQYVNEHWVEKHGRVPYMFDDSAKTAMVAGNFEEMIVTWLTVNEAAQVEAARKELEELRQFKMDADTAALNASIDATMDRFGDLETSIEAGEYAAKARSGEMSVEDLELHLFALRGRNVKSAPKSANNVRVGLDTSNMDHDDPYGGLIERARARRAR